MKRTTALIALLPFLLSANAQRHADRVEALAASLRSGEPTDVLAEHKPIKPKRLDRARAEVWQAWAEANAALSEPKLMAPPPLGAAVTDSLVLPPTLEPHAVMHYFWGEKGHAAAEAKLPAFLYLHGSGPREAEWATGLRLAQDFDDAPSLYIVPRIPNTGAYYRWWQQSKQWAWEWWLRQVLLSPRVDPARLYVFGISEGGYGSQRLAAFYADYWAGAGPMAAGEPLKNAPAENYRHLAFSLLTGAVDTMYHRARLTTLTQQALDSLERVHPADYVHRVQLIARRGHHIDYSPTTPWLAAHQRRAVPSAFTWEDFEMDGRHRRAFYNLEVLRRPTDSLRTAYDVTIAGNCVDISVRDVAYRTVETSAATKIEIRFERDYSAAQGGRLRIFLDETLVDLSRPVMVRVNGRERFHGQLACTRGNMMRAVSLFYDPLRLFPASVEVDY